MTRLSRHRCHWVALSLVAVAGSLALPAAAGAATVSVSATEVESEPPFLVFTAAAGEQNDVRFDVAEKSITVTDAGAVLQPGNGCVAQGERRVVCSASVDFYGVRVTLGDGDDKVVFAPVGQATVGNVTVTGDAGNDSLDASVARGASLEGGDGNDTLSGGPDSDGLTGGAGADWLIGLGGNDRLAGDAGGPPAADRIDGGPGTDEASYTDHPQAIEIDLRSEFPQGAAGENDRLVGIEDVASSTGDDVLRGNDSDNTFTDEGGSDLMSGYGGEDLLRSLDPDKGPDTMSGGAGSDRLSASAGGTASGGPGDDELTGARAVLTGGRGDDTFEDVAGTVSCGRGGDTVRLSRGVRTHLLPGCETVFYGDAGLRLPIRRTKTALVVLISYCSGGQNGNDTCDGPISVKLGRRLLARGGYRLYEAQERRVRMKYRRGAKRALGKRQKRVRVKVDGYVFETYV